MGNVTAPSGELAIFDVGLFGFLPRATLEPALIIVDVPRDRPLPVVAARVGTGRFAECWDHVSIVLGAGEATSATQARRGRRRLRALDPRSITPRSARGSTKNSSMVLADFIFWGRDAAELRARR